MPSGFVRPKGSFRYGLIRPFRKLRAVLGRSHLRLCQQRAFPLRLQDLAQKKLRSDWRGVAARFAKMVTQTRAMIVTIFQVAAGGK
jgi:hypothetical protein